MKKYLLFDAYPVDKWCRVVNADHEVDAVAHILENEKTCFAWCVADFDDGMSYLAMADDIVGQIIDSRDYNCYIFDITDDNNIEVL